MSPRPVVAVGCLALLAACAEQAPLAPAAVAAAGGTVASATIELPATAPWARVIEGETGPGSLYRVYVPATWNGDAVVYAHGIRDVDSPIDLRDQDGAYAVREQLGALGYAVAYSSYSENGFAIKDGAQRTHQLSGLLAATLGGQPKRTFLAAHSLGAGVALSLVESHPDQYAGALLMCGIVGGSRLQTDYMGNVRALADFYFPGRFAGDAISYPAGEPIPTLQQVIAAVQSNPPGLFAIASTAQTPLPYVQFGDPSNPGSPAFQTMVGSLYGALNFHARFINNVVDLVNGSPFGNTGVQYSLGSPVVPALAGPLTFFVGQSNAGVARYAIDQNATNYLDHYFTPTGNLRIPVVTLHNSWDPGVPNFHETAYKAKVDAAGASANLLQRTLPPGTGHCSIPPASAMQGFTALAQWVSTGVKPAF